MLNRLKNGFIVLGNHPEPDIWAAIGVAVLAIAGIAFGLGAWIA